MPANPKLVDPASTPQQSPWDTYLAEATASIVPYVQPLPPVDGDPDAPLEVLVPCPDGDAMDALVAAQRAGDDTAAFVALFGEDVAPRLLLATAKAPFVIRAKIIADVMRHYGMQVASLGN